MILDNKYSIIYIYKYKYIMLKIYINKELIY